MKTFYYLLIIFGLFSTLCFAETTVECKYVSTIKTEGPAATNVDCGEHKGYVKDDVIPVYIKAVLRKGNAVRIVRMDNPPGNISDYFNISFHPWAREKIKLQDKEIVDGPHKFGLAIPLTLYKDPLAKEISFLFKK
ncbi:MAG: hypothetical protein WCG27_03980 [Pseudomonadota bacterium]